MSTVKVYEPCPHCQGNGYYPAPQHHGLTTLTGPNYGPLLVCNACGGTGKGKIKEIRDEPAR